MIEQAVVIFLFLDQRDAFLLACNGTMQGVPQRRRLQLVVPQIILRAAEHRLGEKVFILGRPDDNHGLLRCFGGERSDLKQRRCIRLPDFKKDGVEIIRRDQRQPGVGGRCHRHRDFFGGAQQQVVDALRHFLIAADQ